MTELIFTYQTKNLINGKTYIGVHKTKNLEDGYLGSGIGLQRAIKKYGKDNFSLIPLEFFDTIEEAYEEERFLVNEKWVLNENNYNIALGGHGGFDYVNNNRLNHCRTGVILTIDTKNKIRKSLTGKSKTDKHRKNISNSKKGKRLGYKSKLKGRKLSNTHKSKISKSVSGENNPMFGNSWDDGWKQSHSEFMLEYYKNNQHPNKGNSMSSEQKLKISESCRNQKRIKCDYCGKLATKGNITRWHNENCKEK